jgi:hypothetical protein
MSGKGNCPRNSTAETFYKTLKADLLHIVFEPLQEAEQVIG